MESFIEIYKVPHSVCDKFVRIFHHNEHLTEPGESMTEDGPIKDGPKKSTELTLSLEHLQKITPFWNTFRNSIENYCTKHIGLDMYQNTVMFEQTNLQHYAPSEGFFNSHCERSIDSFFPLSHRLLVFMLYLTDTPNAGTCFPRQNTITECTKGDLIIWPAGFTHPHYGIITDEHEKMILTGWVHRLIENNMDVKDETLEEDEETL